MSTRSNPFLSAEQTERVARAVTRGGATATALLASAIRDLWLLCHHCEASIEGFQQMEIDSMISSLERLEIVAETLQQESAAEEGELRQ